MWTGMPVVGRHITANTSATYERQRDAFDSYRGDPPLQEGYDAYDPIKKWGPGSALYKTTDGGKTFKKLKKGLPTCNLGRMDVDYFRSNPDVLFAIVESEKIAQGTPPKPRPYIGIFGQDAPGGARGLGQSARPLDARLETALWRSERFLCERRFDGWRWQAVLAYASQARCE